MGYAVVAASYEIELKHDARGGWAAYTPVKKDARPTRGRLTASRSDDQCSRFPPPQTFLFPRTEQNEASCLPARFGIALFSTNHRLNSKELQD